MAKRVVSKTVTVGIEDTTMGAIAEAAKLVGAPADARIATGGAGYNPMPGVAEITYAYSATFTWTEEV